MDENNTSHRCMACPTRPVWAAPCALIVVVLISFALVKVMSTDPSTLWLALALVFVIEGVLPFLSPRLWREAFIRAVQMNDGQLRFLGLCSITLGLIALFLLSST